MEYLSDYGSMDVMPGEGYSKSIEEELDSIINGPERQHDFQSLPNRENSPRETEVGDMEKKMDHTGKKDYLSLLLHCLVK